jgi:hypothetical protein
MELYGPVPLEKNALDLTVSREATTVSTPSNCEDPAPWRISVLLWSLLPRAYFKGHLLKTCQSELREG